MSLKLPKPVKYFLKEICIFGGIALAVGMVQLFLFFRTVSDFNNIERNVKKVVTPEQLQTWATNIIGKYPDGANVQFSELGKNFPIKLLKIAPKFRPHVYVYEARDDENPGYVRIIWGSGFMGSSDVQIGPTNFVGRGHQWAPGVYFWDSNRRE